MWSGCGSVGFERDVLICSGAKRKMDGSVIDGAWIDYSVRPWWSDINFLYGWMVVEGDLTEPDGGTGHLGMWKYKIENGKVLWPPAIVLFVESVLLYALFSVMVIISRRLKR